MDDATGALSRARCNCRRRSAGDWKDLVTLRTCYEQPDTDAMRAVVEVPPFKSNAHRNVHTFSPYAASDQSLEACEGLGHSVGHGEAYPRTLKYRQPAPARLAGWKYVLALAGRESALECLNLAPRAGRHGVSGARVADLPFQPRISTGVGERP